MTSLVKGGKNTYGEMIGIIMQERKFPRIPGDIGNAWTFSFPVKYHVIKGLNISTRRKLWSSDYEEFIDPFVAAAKQLEKDGVRAITSSCGAHVQFQKAIADAVNIPVFMSSLLQIPTVYKMLKKDQKVGVITAEAGPHGLGKKHYEAAGAADIPIVTIGMEDSGVFSNIEKDLGGIDPSAIEKEIVKHAKKLVNMNPEIGAIVLECTNMPPYAKAIQEAVELPVFDIVTLTNWVYSAFVKKEFEGYM